MVPALCAGRLVKEGSKTYRYGYLDKVLSVTDDKDKYNSTLSTRNSQLFFTGKPRVTGLGHAFLFRNYRAGLAKWQTADPIGYPDGWNSLAYCGNGAVAFVLFRDNRGNWWMAWDVSENKCMV